MAFIRLKRRSLKTGDEFYAYLVKNSWDKETKRPKQKVAEYLGKLIIPEAPTTQTFEEFKSIPDVNLYASQTSLPTIIGDLVDWELSRHTLDCTYDRTHRRLLRKNKDVVIKLHHGYLCSYTIRRIVNYLKKDNDEEDEREVGKDIAERCLEAGIQIPKEIFIGLFDRVATMEY
ncbi:hypothetical protein H6504_00220 [Candidatus Woesearchaeota archaeon]|nr:hypothetical protein [Candidatus Woesearchaeota archaeon]